MSHVTNVILAFGATLIEEDEVRLLNAINQWNPSGDLRFVETGWDGKALEVNIAIGSFNYLNLKEWVSAIREHIDFNEYQCEFAQLMICGQDDEAFGVINLHGIGKSYEVDDLDVPHGDREEL